VRSGNINVSGTYEYLSWEYLSSNSRQFLSTPVYFSLIVFLSKNLFRLSSKSKFYFLGAKLQIFLTDLLGDVLVYFMIRICELSTRFKLSVVSFALLGNNQYQRLKV
jgi:hypothetical protein